MGKSRAVGGDDAAERRRDRLTLAESSLCAAA